MNNLPDAWSNDKYQELISQLTGYWAEDIWDLKKVPLTTRENKRAYGYLKFLCPSERVNNEVKYAVRQKFVRGEWSINYMHHLYRTLKWFEDEIAPNTYSLTEKRLAEWEAQFDKYHLKLGMAVIQYGITVTKAKGIFKFSKMINYKSALRSIYKEVSDFYDRRPEYEKDIWQLSRMGIAVARKMYDRLNFTQIHQTWLRQIVKRYMRYRLSYCSIGNLRVVLHDIKKFSSFLLERHPQLSGAGINRRIITEYLGYLSSKNFSVSTRLHSIINLRLFLEVSAREEWAAFPKERIIYEEDLPRKPQRIPRYIPDFVINQLFQHLDELAVRFQRMIYILYEVGMRVNDLLTLPFDCLMQDSEGGWWIKYYQSKLKSEHTQPITIEIAAAIQAQQKEIYDNRGQSLYLFPNSKGEPYSRLTLSNALNKLAIEKKICDAAGAIWWFEPHQFRHTFGTRHINNGMPHHIVQRLMGHKSPTMTSQYAHIHDATLKREFEKALSERRLIDISGQPITESSVADAAELQWLKKHINARVLPNGYCGRPIILEECPTPSMCLHCPHFRTDHTFLGIHVHQLNETEKLIQISRNKGWATQLRNSERDKISLINIIDAIKENSDGAQA